MQGASLASELCQPCRTFRVLGQKSLQKCLKASGLCLVHGAGGMGKTVATCASIQHEESLSELFPDGVAYVTVGQAPDLVVLQGQLLQAFGVQEPPRDLSDGYSKLFGALSGLKALIVLDDVWIAQHLEPFAPLKGRPKSWQGNAVLITTRQADLLPSAELLRLGEITDAEAKQLLDLEGDPSLLSKLTKLCSRSPLALSILGAVGRLEHEQKPREKSSIFTAFSSELAQEKEAKEANAIKRCIGLATKRLSVEERKLYLGMAVFPDDVLLPVAALRHIFPKKDLGALQRLEDLHLIRIECPNPGGDDLQFVRLHDLSLEFVKEQATQKVSAKKLHQELLDAYSSALEVPGEWWTGPDDGYYFQRLLHHLALAGQEDEGRALLLRWEWMAARIRRPGDVLAMVADLRAFAPKGSLQSSPLAGSGITAVTALGASPQAKARAGRKAASTPAAAAKPKPKASAACSLEPKISEVLDPKSPESVWNALVEVLTLSAHILTEDASQLPFQVLGRFLAFQESESGPVAAICPGATAALEAGVYTVDGPSRWKTSICPVSKGTLQGVGGPLQRTLQLHQDWVRCLAVNCTGTLLASASNDLSVKIWDLTEDCRLLLELLGHSSSVFTVDLNDSQVISGDKDEAILWSLADGTSLRRWSDFQSQLSVVHFFKEDLAMASSSEVHLASTGSGDRSAKSTKLSHEARVAAMDTAAFPGHFLMACGCVDAHVVLWRLAGKPGMSGPEKFVATMLSRFSAGDQDVRAVSFSDKGDLLAAGNDDSSLRIWTIVMAEHKNSEVVVESLCSASLHTDWIHSVNMSQNGSLVASGSDDNSISLYDVKKQQRVGVVRIFSGAFSVVLLPNSNWLFSASGDIRLWNVPKMIRQMENLEMEHQRHCCAIAAVTMQRDGLKALAVSSDQSEGKPNGGLQLSSWDCATAAQQSFLIVAGSKEDDDRPLCICLSPDGSTAAVGCDTGKLWFLSTKDGKTVWDINEAHGERIFCCEWLEEDCIATGSEDGTVSCWSLTGRCCTASARPYDSGVRCFAWTHDGRRVLCGGDYQSPCLMQLGAAGEEGHRLMEYKDIVRQELTVSTSCSISLSSDDQRAVTCSWDKALRVWDVNSGELLLVVTQVSDWVVKGFGATLAGDCAGLCVSYSWDRQLQLWNLPCLHRTSEKPQRLVVIDSKEAPQRLSSCQCDASLVHMACVPRWQDTVRRSLAFSDEDGGMHFFKVEMKHVS